MDEIVDKWRLVLARLSRRHYRSVSIRVPQRRIWLSALTFVVEMSLHIPVSVSVTGVIVLGASNLNLTETPLRQVDITSSQVATQSLVLKTESGGKGANLALVPGRNIPNNFDFPVILVVTHGQVAVAGNLLVSLSDGRRDVVRVQVAAGLRVDESDYITVAKESKLVGALVVIGIAAVRVEEPVVVSILVVVTGDLLLSGTLGVRLHVRVQETTGDS